MGENSKIAWTNHTFNPWWGCVRVSPGCEHCYAESFSKRTGHDVWGVTAQRRAMSIKHWGLPDRWNAMAI
jgi:protein gp37